MVSLFTVRDIGINKHVTTDYAILNIVMLGLNHEGRFVKAVITKEIYIVKGLKAKMLIEVDVIGPKKININMTKKTVYVGFCDIDVPVFTKSYARNLVSRIIYIKSTVFIPPYLTAALLIYHI